MLCLVFLCLKTERKKERKIKQAVQKIYLLMTTHSDTRQIHAA